MGTLNLQGAFGVPQNFENAVHYFQQAADQNDPAGMANLGIMYAHGFGVTPNNETALQYFKKAAEAVREREREREIVMAGEWNRSAFFTDLDCRI
jgi:TPR repeat protein